MLYFLDSEQNELIENVFSFYSYLHFSCLHVLSIILLHMNIESIEFSKCLVTAKSTLNTIGITFCSFSITIIRILKNEFKVQNIEYHFSIRVNYVNLISKSTIFRGSVFRISS